MALHAEITREIRTGPAGASIGALFDLDRTLLAGFSALALFRERLLSGRLAPRDLLEAVAGATNFSLGRIGFSGLMAASSGMFRGMAESAMREFGRQVFESQLAKEIYPESRALVQAHEAKRHTLAIVSSATRYQIEPIAQDLGIEHVLCTEMEVRDGAFTGAIVPPACYGEGKLVAARGLAERTGIDLSRSYFYTDSYDDLPLLEAVGHPRPLNPDLRLAARAAAEGWPTRVFHSRGAPGVLDVVRTGLTVASLGTSVLAGIPAALLNGSRRQAVNVAVTTWGEVGTMLAGIDLRVEGEEHLWSHRPAVFIFNHQSGIDMLLLCKLLRRDIVGIAKQEVRSNPIFGPMFLYAGTVFLDRFDRTKAIAALEPAVDALKRGLSIVISPEGTRSPTPRLGVFKKGPFHIAMRAGVPIVPIIFRNALDALPKHGRIIRPTTIEAVVRPPIPTEGWKRADLDEHVEEVHRLFEETLAT